MVSETLSRNVALKDQLLEILRHRIQNNLYPAESMFPSESELADEFEISRATVRSALAVLVAEGRLVRKHGVGTFVSRITNIKNPINRAMGFFDLISKSGFSPGVTVNYVELEDADEALQTSLGLDPGDQVLSLYKTFTAHDSPVILVSTKIPVSMLGDKTQDVLSEPSITEPLFDYLEKEFGQRTEKMITSFWPDTLESADLPIEKFKYHNLDLTAPVLLMEYVAYNSLEEPIFFSYQAYLGKFMKFNLIRLREEQSVEGK